MWGRCLTIGHCVIYGVVSQSGILERSHGGSLGVDFGIDSGQICGYCWPSMTGFGSGCTVPFQCFYGALCTRFPFNPWGQGCHHAPPKGSLGVVLYCTLDISD